MQQKKISKIWQPWIVLFTSICWSYPAYAVTDFVNQIPDFTQTDIKGSHSGNGQQFCAPVAVSNSITVDCISI